MENLLALLLVTSALAYSIAADCPTGWLGYKDHCYLFHSITATLGGKSWHDARLSCQLYGGDLADIRDKNESDFIFKSQTALMRRQHFWLGCSDHIQEGVYQFPDGTNCTYLNWNKGEPNNFQGNEDCVETHYDGSVNDNKCDREFAYICKKKKGAPTPPLPTPPPQPTGSAKKPSCDAGWIGFNRNCYLFVQFRQRNFEEARQDCRDRGGDLAMPKTKEEQTYLEYAARNTYKNYWIGLTDMFKEGDFVWVDGTKLDPNITNWAPNEPSNAFGGEDCVQMYSTYKPGKWNDNHCSAKLNFVCEKPTGASLCPEGWSTYGDWCYQFNVHPAQKMSWEAARNACLAYDGADLASITSAEEQAMIVKTARNYGTTYGYMWTGLNDRRKEGAFEWSDGTHPVSYTNWESSQPQTGTYYAKIADCVRMTLANNQGRWSVVSCRTSFYFVCKRKREYGRCHDPLGMQDFTIGNEKITASSEKSPTTPAFAARWNQVAMNGLDGAWCAADNAKNPFLKIDLGEQFKVRFIGTQGKSNTLSYVSSYYLMFSTDDKRWSTYGYNPPTPFKIIRGNSHADRIGGRIVELVPPATAKYLKIFPLQYQGGLCMRVEVFGCKAEFVTSCGKNWIPGTDSRTCYRFSMTQLTWTAARANCIATGGDLLSITSLAERNFINQQLKNYKDRSNQFWIGLNDRDVSRLYRWSDGSPLSVVNWYRGNPKDKKDRLDCIGVTSQNGYWFDDSCYTKRPYICKRQAQVLNPRRIPFNSNWISSTDHYWPLDEIVDGRVLGTRTGQVFGNFKTDSAFLNRKHLAFDGSSTYIELPDFKQSCVSVPNKCALGLSVSFLLKLPTGLKIDQVKRFILDTAGQNSSDVVGWSIYIMNGRLSFMVRERYRSWLKTVTIKAGSWTHLVFTWSRSSVTIYKDGAYFARTVFGMYKSKFSDQEVTSLFVGTSATAKGAMPAFEMMSLAIWERSLNPQEISQIFKAEMMKCEPGWIMFGQYCYLFEPTRRTWDQSYINCRSLGGELTSINSGVEQSLISIGVGASGIATNAWIGLNSKKLDHIYNWTDGSQIVFTNWAMGEPNNMFGYRREDCTEVWQSGMWNDEVCGIMKSQICKKEKSVPALTPVDKDGFQRNKVISQYSILPISCPLGTSIVVKSAFYGKLARSCSKDVTSTVQTKCATQKKVYCLLKSSNDDYGEPCKGVVKELNVTYACTPDNSFFQDYTIGCPSGWSLRPGKNSCYKIFYQKKTWLEAQNFCKSASSGAHLVSIRSRTEQVFVTSLLISAYENADLWNGLSDRTSPGQYKWSDNSVVTYTAWRNGQPDDSARQQSCVKMNLKPGFGDSLLWIDDDCDHKHGFVCEVLKKGGTETPLVTTKKPIGGCPVGWTQLKNHCYQLNITRLTWLDARDACRKIGGDLASIWERKENELIFNLIVSGPGKATIYDAWIGLTDKGIVRGQVWSDGTPVSFTLWDSMEPNSYLNMKACGVMWNNGNWRDDECSLKKPFVCKTLIRKITTPPPTTTAASTPTQDPTICPDGWRWFSGNGMCYFFKNTSYELDWYGARRACRNAGGDLVSIANQQEQNFVASFISSYPGRRVWIGLSDLSTEGGFTWSDGTPLVFRGFELNQPDDWHGMEDCVEIRNSGTWNDAMCSRTFPFMCKRPNNKASVTTTVPPTAGPVSGYCDPGWLHYRNKCYKMVYGDKGHRTWKAAQTYCRAITNSERKGDLVSIHSSYENAFLNSAAYGIGETLWIGLNDLQIERQFGWSDQSVVQYTNWNYRQPDDFARREDCVELVPYFRHHGKWNDVDCSKFRGFICQSDATQTKPTGKPTPSSECPANYESFAGNCYSYKNTPATWDKARETCRKENAKSELVSIHTPFEQDYVFSYFVEYTTDLWIGFHRMQNDTKYIWSDNSPADYTYWKGGLGSLSNDKKTCVYAHYNSRESGRWGKSTCDKKYPFMCKVTKDDIGYVPDYPGTCPSGWLKRNKYCYLIQGSFYSRAQWASARQKCRSLGGDLLSIHGKDEQAFISNQIKNEYRSFWIGLNDRSRENGFVWSDDSPLDFAYWNVKEPNDKGGTENCVEMNPVSGRWNDLRCSQYLGYICKKNLECSSALGIENGTIPDNKISASSHYGQNFPQAGRLNYKGTTRGWCTNKTDDKQYLQIDLGMTTRLTGIATQGAMLKSISNYVLTYRLYYSEDNVVWKPYKVNGKTELLSRKGNGISTDNVQIKAGQAGRYFRINPVTWKGDFICLLVELYGCNYVCEAPLGVESHTIKDSAMTASSSNPKFKPSYGRLSIPGGRAWCALTDNERQWLQVDLAGTVQISKVATQGVQVGKDTNVVTAYKISYSDDGVTFTDYKAINGEIRIFSGNTFPDSAIFHRFTRSVTGRYIRFHPLRSTGHICLRVEVYGCPLGCNQALGLENGKISSSAISASSSESSLHYPGMARLNKGGNGEGAWCAAVNNRQQFLEVHFEKDTRITAIATQGFDGDISKYVTDYILQYSIDGKFWTTYAVKGMIEVFQGNNNGYTPNKVELKIPLHGRYVRINPQHWKQGICMRIELYGCPLHPDLNPTEEPPPKKKVFKGSVRFPKSEWKPALSDKESKDFKDLASKVEVEITRLYLDDYAFKDGFESVTVTGFRSGSVIVEFIVIFRTEDTKMTAPLKKAVESGKIGTLIVDKESFKIQDVSEGGKTGKQTGGEGSSGLSRGGKIALVVFFMVLIVVIVVGGVVWYWRKRRQTNQFAPKSFENPVHYDPNTYNIGVSAGDQ